MIVWLDHLIFGSGHGFGSPFWDSRFYWLVDTLRKKRSGKFGQLYTYWPGFGAQLHSVQWTHPNAGEERELSGKKFRPFHSYRKWGRVMVAWAATDLPAEIDAAQKWFKDFEQSLGSAT